jgi:MOSC domain-containing protein YiiM
MQVTLMNARAVNLIARSRERWGLAGDQLFVDFDLSEDNVPPGTRLVIGGAEIEVSKHPHTGCKKFLARFGQDALEFVNSPEGRRMHLRGINAKIVRGGVVKVGDGVRKAEG